MAAGAAVLWVVDQLLLRYYKYKHKKSKEMASKPVAKAAGSD